MPSYVPPKNGVEFITYVGLVAQSDTRFFQSNPTLAAGDFKVSIDGGALNNLTTLPAVTPGSSKAVKITLSAAEMTGDNIQVIGSDAAGAEWCDIQINIQTSARKIDDLAYPATSGRSILVAAAGGVALDWANVQSPTTTVGLSGTTIATSQVVASVSGAVGSVTGAVGSVTGNVAGNVTGSIGSLATQAKADVNAEVVDCLNVDTYAEPTGAPAATATLVSKIGRLHQVMRNKITVDATAKTFFNDAGSALWSKGLADSGTLYTESEGA